MILNLDKLQKDSTPYDNFLIFSIIVAWILHDFTIFYRIVPYSTIFYHMLPKLFHILPYFTHISVPFSLLQHCSNNVASSSLLLGRHRHTPHLWLAEMDRWHLQVSRMKQTWNQWCIMGYQWLMVHDTKWLYTNILMGYQWFTVHDTS